jgi:hypothetical protein
MCSPPGWAHTRVRPYRPEALLTSMSATWYESFFHTKTPAPGLVPCCRGYPVSQRLDGRSHSGGVRKRGDLTILDLVSQGFQHGSLLVVDVLHHPFQFAIAVFDKDGRPQGPQFVHGLLGGGF